MSTLDSLTHHKEVLEQRHRLLDKVISDLYKQNSDDVLIHTMKKEKLQLIYQILKCLIINVMKKKSWLRIKI